MNDNKDKKDPFSSFACVAAQAGVTYEKMQHALYAVSTIADNATASERSDALRLVFNRLIEKNKNESEQLLPRNCPNCGAPVRGSECEYCGTVFVVGNDVDLALDADAVASVVRRYTDSGGRTFRHFNPKTHQWEWVEENPAKAVRTPQLPTKHGRG